MGWAQIRRLAAFPLDFLELNVKSEINKHGQYTILGLPSDHGLKTQATCVFIREKGKVGPRSEGLPTTSLPTFYIKAINITSYEIAPKTFGAI
jgi:hypothetical protein